MPLSITADNALEVHESVEFAEGAIVEGSSDIAQISDGGVAGGLSLFVIVQVLFSPAASVAWPLALQPPLNEAV